MSLQDIRDKIDAIDADLLRILNERTRLSKEVGRIKLASGQAVFAPGREEVLLRRLLKQNKGPLPAESLRSIYREILSASRSLQKQLTVGYFGPEGTYCHQAAMARFGSGDTYVPCRSVPEVFDLLSREAADACVIPVDNSIECNVNVTQDMLVTTDLQICGEIYLRISHVLAAAKKQDKVKRVFSHPWAMSQCRQWLAAHHPGMKQIECSSMYASARHALEEHDSAAIVSPFAARIFGLKVLHNNIQDMAPHITRFLILSRQQPAPTGNDKTSLLFAGVHEVETLSQVLRLFAEHRLNLKKIESRPSGRKEHEYLFFVDVEGHSQQAKFRKALGQIRQKTLWLKILGSYPQSQHHV